jgi:molecular chaperone DnaK
MSGRLAIDFGTSNTVIARWDETTKEARPVHIPEFGQLIQQGNEQISIIPSLIHYAKDHRRWIGNQVLTRDLYNSKHTFRWMKRYINNRSPVKIRIDGQEISYFDAGTDFLSNILAIAIQTLDIKDEEIALTVPVEAYEDYEDWLTGVSQSAGLPRFRLIDEPSAAALGYGVHILPGNVYLIFDFGGGTIHAAVVLIEAEERSVSGRRCRVLGKAGREIGGTSIDQWLYQEVVRINNRSDFDEDIRLISNSLLVECERLKEALSFEERATLNIPNPQTGAVLSAEFSRNAFEELLDQHDLYTDIDRTVRAALNDSRERGYSEDDIQSVLMVGGSSQIPSVQRTLRQIFGKERVSFNRPLDAVARGGASFVAGVDFYDHIQHDYAIRYVYPEKGGYSYHVIVRRGTPYPTREPVARITVKAAYDNQTQLGIAVFEMGEKRKTESTNPVELVFDPTGAARIMQVTPDEQEKRVSFWMNEHTPTFLKADSPARQSEPRFEVEFNIDVNKRLLMTVRDILTGKLTYQDFPVVKLT